MDIDQAGAAAILYNYAKDPVETFANNLYESRKMSAASVVHTEEERAAVMEADNVTYSLSLEGTSMSLSGTTNNEEHIISLIDDGKPTPYTKGKDGTRTEIDGSTGPSHSYSEGYALPEYAWDATHFKEETYTILKTTSPELIYSTVPEAKDEIANTIIKPTILQELRGEA